MNNVISILHDIECRRKYLCINITNEMLLKLINFFKIKKGLKRCSVRDLWKSSLTDSL